jgi:REP element-mobilizing transposase RayT
MTRRRCDIVDAENCGVYHCISRCVRRQSLIACIERREWVVSRLEFLAQSAAIDVISFAVMENHLHLLLRTRPEVVRGWTDREVALRRARMLPNRRLRRSVGTPLDGEPTDEEIAAIMSSPRHLEKARADLSSLGFFHRLLKEPCARLWNREDEVTGHFWEGRYKSPRVLDEPAVRRVARYIELNEIRAGSAKSIQTSVWSSAWRQWSRMCEVLRNACDVKGGGEEAELKLAIAAVRWEPVFGCETSGAIEDGEDCNDSDDEGIEKSDGKLLGCRQPLFEYVRELERDGRRRHPSKTGWIGGAIPTAMQAAIDATLRVGRDLTHVAATRLAELWFGGGACDSGGDWGRDSGGEWGFCGVESADSAEHHPPRGGCYGSAESRMREATRRGQRWILAAELG